MSKLISFFIVVILVMQAIFLYLLINPIKVVEQLNSVSIINEVSKLANSPVPITELPQIGLIGDGKTLAKAEDIKKNNQVDAEVYANAKDGDYVLGYSTRLIIYRPSEKKVIYDGLSPAQKLQSGQKTLVDTVLKKTMDANLIPKDYNQVPQISVVTSPEELKKNNDFYKEAAKDDLVATFTTPNLVVIYRPATQQIVKSGQFQVSLK